MKIDSILWATDGSQEADLALGYAKYLAGLTGAGIIGLHVIPVPGGLFFEALRERDASFDEWQNDIENQAGERFADAKKELEESGIPFEGVLVRGKPAEEIIAFAKERSVGLIAMGKRGHSLLERVVVGSETGKVLRGSHAPVLAVKRDRPFDGGSLKQILVPLDLSDEAESGFMFALDLAGLTGAEVTAIYALRLDMYAQDIPAGALDIVIKESYTEMANTASRLSKKYEESRGVKLSKPVATDVVHGISPALSIAQYAKENDTDLIVINTHGRKGIERLVLGSVTERLIPESPCSVIALKP
jgi:nucleotide-binding universal stress UspA family protein